jgi:glycosyltransferase involved in cell wall biosynthesis
MTYNRAGTLHETLESILPQVSDRPEVEVLVSDNASADGTRELVQEYSARHPRLRYSRNPVNVGFDGNVVACLENAAGEYAAFFSDDDIAPPDYVPRLLEDLKECRPVVAYLNHAPFFHDNLEEAGVPTQPILKRVFTNPTEYFLYTGLGFISSLVLKTSEARKHTSSIVHDRGTAHVDIASRTVLSTTGACLFDGTITVLARCAYDSGYDPLQFGAMNTTQVHLDLLREGLLTQRDVDWHNRKTIRLFLQRLIFNNRLNRRKIISAAELRKLYGRDPLFYIYAYPLALIPAPLLRFIGLPLRALMRRRRRWLSKRGKIGAQPIHLAPS